MLKVGKIVPSIRGHVIEMYGCCYGCFSQTFTSDHEMFQTSDFEEIALEFDKAGRFFPNVIGTTDGLHLQMKISEQQKF